MNQKFYIDSGPLAFPTKSVCEMTVLRGYTRFSVTVEIAKVERTRLGKQLLQQIETWETRPWEKSRDEPFLDLIYQHCLPLFERLAPQTSLRDLSLEEFIHLPTYNLELYEGDNNVACIKGESLCLYTPAFFISPVRTDNLPEICQAAPRFQARTIRVARAVREQSIYLDSIQGRVETDKGSSYYFKPRLEMREPDFERELHILSRIKEAGLTDWLRIPKLEGIVVSGEETIGMLITLIDGNHLRNPDLQGMHEKHGTWEDQLRAIIRELHAHGIVWGDVHPMNIMIDKAMNAWAIDFGGMNNVEFVDDKNRETIEGDLQGITRVFQDWLPNL